MKRYSYLVEDIVGSKKFAMPTLESVASFTESSIMTVFKACKAKRVMKQRWVVKKIDNKKFIQQFVREMEAES